MKYGCIGERLKHSFSKEIHNALADYEYELCEVERDGLAAFMEKRDFNAINVTIPYKEDVIPYMYFVDDGARRIGAVNTVVNRDGKLYGYNTDFFGMKMLLSHAKVEIKGKKVIILGTGGTSKTAMAVARDGGASEILRVSRTARGDAISYLELYSEHNDADVIINTTPVGTFPNIDDSPIELDSFKNLSGVIDAVYNPLRTALVSKAMALGIPASSGLYMLVAQAVRASEIFLDKSYQDGILDALYEKIFKDKENVVLIGMPASGKSTVGKMLADRMERAFVDTDELIRERTGMEIAEIFRKYGERYFRELEAAVVSDISKKTGLVIATGGGVPLREENVRRLKQNGKLIFLDRPLSSLMPTEDRPLAQSAEAIEKLYHARYGVYTAAQDARVSADLGVEDVVEAIERIF